MNDVVKTDSIELRCGDYRDVLADMTECNAVVSDPPFGQKTHDGQRHRRRSEKSSDHKPNARGLEYGHWAADDVSDFVSFWSRRCSGWIAAMTSHDLGPVYEREYLKARRCQFAPLACIVPIACVQHGMNVRLAGDGPSNWSVWLMVSRPRTKAMATWGTLRGAYVGPSTDGGENALDRSKRAVAGAKPLWLMRAIVRDYTRPGDLVVDPCAGGATTLIAAAIEGRRAIGAELDPSTFEKAKARILQGHTPDMFTGTAAGPRVMPNPESMHGAADGFGGEDFPHRP